MNWKKTTARLFPFLPLVLVFAYSFYRYAFCELDAQEPVVTMLLLVLSFLVMWLFATAGLVYSVFRASEFRYFKILFFILSALNLLSLPLVFLFGLLPPVAVIFIGALFLAGVYSIKRYNAGHQPGDDNKKFM